MDISNCKPKVKALVLEAILEANGVENGKLYEGQQLVVPRIYKYTVKEGDTLCRIARVFGTTPDVLYEDNRLTNPEHLVPGDELILPPCSEKVIQRTTEFESRVDPTKIRRGPKNW